MKMGLTKTELSHRICRREKILQGVVWVMRKAEDITPVTIEGRSMNGD
jgi:hypothetical protein